MTSTTPEATVTNGMFSNLTRDDLSALHEQLGQQHSAIMSEMFTDSYAPRVKVGGPEWTEIKAREVDVYETMTAVFTELRHRDAEEAAGDLDEYPLTGVPMVCAACRKPAEAASGRDGEWWNHQSAQDSSLCPGATGQPVTVMVAEGNENVPRG